MKKFFSIITIPILFSIISCSKEESKNEDTIFLSRAYNVSSLVEITSSNQLNNIVRYDSAMIIVSKEGCSYCSKLFSQVREIIKKENILVYFIDINKYLESYNDVSNKEGSFANLLPKISSTPTTLFYSGGEIKNYFMGVFDDIEKELFEYVSFTNIYMINDFHIDKGKTDYYIDFEEEHDFYGIGTNNLDSLIENNLVTVMFSWRKCQDCKEYYQYVLYPYLFKNTTKKIYVYEVDGYYSLKNYLDENNNPNNDYLNLWYSFSSKYHLTDYEFYDKYSHLSGVVPTIVSFDSTSYSINVFRNDYNIIINSDNTLSYGNSFYEEVKQIKSKTKVNSSDTSSNEYITALKELRQLSLELEITLATKYLENNL